jgi:hypothetical protein
MMIEERNQNQEEDRKKEQVVLIQCQRYIFYLRKNTTKDDRAYLKDALIDKTEEEK